MIRRLVYLNLSLWTRRIHFVVVQCKIARYTHLAHLLTCGSTVHMLGIFFGFAPSFSRGVVDGGWYTPFRAVG